MTAASPRATFRDPAGSLRFEGELAVRRIAPSARAEVLDFLQSPLCQAMQQRGDLIAAAIDDSGPQLILRHPRIPVPTYPWEWTPSQWLAAADLTLNLCEEAIAAGWGPQGRHPAQRPLPRPPSHLRRHSLLRTPRSGAPRSQPLHLARLRTVRPHLPASSADESPPLLAALPQPLSPRRIGACRMLRRPRLASSPLPRRALAHHPAHPARAPQAPPTRPQKKTHRKINPARTIRKSQPTSCSAP